MSITLELATPDSLDEIVDAVASWQNTGGPVQLHPGDLGWNWSLGTTELVEALRVWRRDGEIVAVGMGDDGGLIRMGIAPHVDSDEGFAARLLADLVDVGSVESRAGLALCGLLRRSGWVNDEPWTPLARDLTDPVEDSGLRMKVVDASDMEDRVAVQRAAFAGSSFTAERWHAMAATSAYRRARCLVGYDRHDHAVATVTVWSAGEGRPGLLEPLGVHRDHRGHGYGTAISIAAAAALRELAASTATVCTPSSNVGAVAAYSSAGYARLPEVTDLRRPD